MTTLTRRRPPIPVAATHQVEVIETADNFGDAQHDYLHALFDKLILPHTEWSRGVGQSATSASVFASIGPSPQSIDINEAAFVTLGLPQTTAAVSGRAVLLAIALLKREPAPQWAYYFDGVLLQTVPYTVPRPPRIPLPPAPGAGLRMVEVDDENEPDYLAPKAAYESGLLFYTIDKAWQDRWAHVTHYWHGIVESVQVSAKTALVRLDPFPDATDAVEQSCGFGTRAWTAAQLQGKRVRVGIDPLLGWWIDDLE